VIPLRQFQQELIFGWFTTVLGVVEQNRMLHCSLVPATHGNQFSTTDCMQDTHGNESNGSERLSVVTCRIETSSNEQSQKNSEQRREYILRNSPHPGRQQQGRSDFERNRKFGYMICLLPLMLLADVSGSIARRTHAVSLSEKSRPCEMAESLEIVGGKAPPKPSPPNKPYVARVYQD
jgi:hypothetical protein